MSKVVQSTQPGSVQLELQNVASNFTSSNSVDDSVQPDLSRSKPVQFLASSQLANVQLPQSEETQVKSLECDLTNPVLCNDNVGSARRRSRKSTASIRSDRRSNSATPYSRSNSFSSSRSKSRSNTNIVLPSSKNNKNKTSNSNIVNSDHVQPESMPPQTSC